MGKFFRFNFLKNLLNNFNSLLNKVKKALTVIDETFVL